VIRPTQRLESRRDRTADCDLIRWLIFLEMYDEALDEVKFAERAWGTSTALAATRAWLLTGRASCAPPST